MDHDQILRKHLLYLLRGGGAHLNLDEAIEGVPPEVQGSKPEGVPHLAPAGGSAGSSGTLAAPRTGVRSLKGKEDQGRKPLGGAVVAAQPSCWAIP